VKLRVDEHGGLVRLIACQPGNPVKNIFYFRQSDALWLKTELRLTLMERYDLAARDVLGLATEVQREARVVYLSQGLRGWCSFSMALRRPESVQWLANALESAAVDPLELPQAIDLKEETL
jgi:hypothetical protein